MQEPRPLSVYPAGMLYTRTQSSRTSAGLLLLRILIGLAFVFHGMPKIQHFPGWMGPQAFAPVWLQGIVALVDFVGGIAFIFGFLTPLVAFLIGIDMVTAIFMVHLPSGGHFVGGRMSFETPLFYLIAMIAFLLMGPGMYSIDAMLARRTPRAMP